MSFDLFGPTDVFLMLARRGAGKTHLARKISATYPRRVIFDPLVDYSSDDGHLVFTFDEFCAALLAAKNSEKFSIVYRFDPESSFHQEEFNEALRVLWYLGDVLIHIEEVQFFAPTFSQPHWFKQALFTGRHQNLAFICTSLRPGDCSKALVSQANHVFIGSLHEKNDLAYVRVVLGDYVGMLPHLRERAFYYFRPGKPLTLVSNDLQVLGLPKIKLEESQVSAETESSPP